jgi:hypothetical protein
MVLRSVLENPDHVIDHSGKMLAFVHGYDTKAPQEVQLSKIETYLLDTKDSNYRKRPDIENNLNVIMYGINDKDPLLVVEQIKSTFAENKLRNRHNTRSRFSSLFKRPTFKIPTYLRSALNYRRIRPLTSQDVTKMITHKSDTRETFDSLLNVVEGIDTEEGNQ